MNVCPTGFAVGTLDMNGTMFVVCTPADGHGNTVRIDNIIAFIIVVIICTVYLVINRPQCVLPTFHRSPYELVPNEPSVVVRAD